MASEESESKKQRNEECIINGLQWELFQEILLRLPVSTLLRSIGVCKQWRTFIRDPHFVTSHLQHSPHCAFLFFPQESVYGKRYPSDAILIDEAWSQSKCAVPVIGPDDFLFGSCNGLLGLYTKTSTIKIANFATGECLHLEKPVKNLRGDHFTLYNFGFHPVTKEYKITHFLGDCLEGQPHNKDRFSVIQVYTLGDEKWKDIRTPKALSLNCVRNSGVVNVDGTMYWLTEDMIASCQHAVMSLDLGEESFVQIQLPTALEVCAYGGPRRYWIREIDGKICVATGQTNRTYRVLVGKLHIWTLEGKVEQRWSQKYIIQSSPDYILGPHFFHRDRIMTQSDSRNLYSYELFGENCEIKLCKMAKLLDFSPRKAYNMQSYICVKSLVCLDVYKKASIVHRPKQREGWDLKKWEAWEDELSRTEKEWSNIHQLEHDKTEDAQLMVNGFNQLLQHISDEMIRQEIDMKINQIIPKFPDQKPRSLRRLNFMGQKQDLANFQARSYKYKDIEMAITQTHESIISTIRSYIQDQSALRRLNWVKQKRDMENLFAFMDKYKEITEAMTEATGSVISMMCNSRQDQKGTSSSNASISSQNHSVGDDTKT